MCVTSPRPRCPPTRRPGHQGRGGVQAGLRAVSCGFRSARQAIFRGLRLELESVPLLMMCLHSRRSGGGGGHCRSPQKYPQKQPPSKWAVGRVRAWPSRTRSGARHRGRHARSGVRVRLPGRLQRGVRFPGSYTILLFLKLCVSYIALPTPSLIFED